MSAAPTSGLPEVVLQMRGVVKHYPGTTALHGVDYQLYAGAVNVLVGENGAGKSTMMKIIAGVEAPSGGQVLLGGQPVQLRSTEEARAKGIAIVFQELNLFPNLSVMENLFAGRELRTPLGFIDRAAQRQRAREVMTRLEHDIDPDTLVGTLRVGQQQVVEIAKALVQPTRILILDEPTSALSAPEVTVLFKVIGQLRAQGVAIVYISHRLEELVRIGDHVTVLRDGRITGSARMADVDVPWIVRQMVGDALGQVERPAYTGPGEVVLEARDIRLPRPLVSGNVVDGVSLTLRQGEVVGLYGLMGAGRSELFECLIGCWPQTAIGSVLLRGEQLLGKDVADCLAAGLALVPEDRKAEGLVQALSVAGNLTLASLPRMARLGWISAKVEQIAVRGAVKRMTVKTADPSLPIDSLSGGNQQKVVIGRALMTQPCVLLLDEPSRGIDIGAKAEVFRVMRELAQSGMAVMFVSSDLHEVMSLADRLLVMSQGRITAEFAAGEATNEALVAAASAGLAPHRAAA